MYAYNNENFCIVFTHVCMNVYMCLLASTTLVGFGDNVRSGYVWVGQRIDAIRHLILYYGGKPCRIG